MAPRLRLPSNIERGVVVRPLSVDTSAPSSASGEAFVCSGSRSGRAGPGPAVRGVPPRREARCGLAGSRGPKTEDGGQRSPAGRREAAGGSSAGEGGRWTADDREVAGAGGGSPGPSGAANAGGGRE